MIQRVLIVPLLLGGVAAVAGVPNGLVMLLTDYGADSVYAGAIKGAVGDRVEVQIGKSRSTAPVRNSYSNVAAGEKIILVQSHGYVELAINPGDLQETTNEGLRAPGTLRKAQ